MRVERGAMRAFTRTAARVLVAVAALGVGACAMVSDGVDRASQYDGATPGTVPGHVGEPSGPLDNGLLPEPGGDTS